MTEFEQQMLAESKKQTSHLASIKAFTMIMMVIASMTIGYLYVS